MKKNVNAKISEEVMREFQVLAWYMDVNRSELVRRAIEQYRRTGKIDWNHEVYEYDQLLNVAKEALEQKGQEIEDLVAKNQRQQGKNGDSSAYIPDKFREVEKLVRELREDYENG